VAEALGLGLHPHRPLQLLAGRALHGNGPIFVAGRFDPDLGLPVALQGDDELDAVGFAERQHAVHVNVGDDGLVGGSVHDGAGDGQHRPGRPPWTVAGGGPGEA
jgi:hypothetical protein